MKICVTTTIYTHTGGLIRLYIVIWSVLSQFKWLLLFLHHAWRGHGARLSIRTKDPNNHSDTETGTRSKKFFCKVIFFVIVVFFSQNVFNRNPFLQLRERVRIEIGYFLELFLNLRPPPPGTFLVPKDFFSPFSG